tara:strand:- start:44 stop:520 length:477 start_codon:yes stop_codon:yes gene_type:complete
MGRRRFKYFVPSVIPEGYTPPASLGHTDPYNTLDILAGGGEYAYQPPPPTADDVATTTDTSVAKARFETTTDKEAGKDDHFIGVDSTVGGVIITLPNTANLSIGKTFLIKDEGGKAGTNPITIRSSDGASIDGQERIRLVSDYAAINVYYNGTGWSVY